MDDNIFRIENKLQPRKGRVLIAEPFLDDYYFKKSIILLTEHNEDGSMGFVINNPVNLKLNELLNGFPEFEANISVGGPVSTDSVQFVHLSEIQLTNSIEVRPNLFWGGDFEDLKEAVLCGNVDKNEIIFFIGYSGWSPGQLEAEIKENSWIVTELPTDIIMKYNKNVWQRTLHEMGERYKAWANFPEDPNLN
jgi:putative transcriptional regulator